MTPQAVIVCVLFVIQPMNVSVPSFSATVNCEWSGEKCWSVSPPLKLLAKDFPRWVGSVFASVTRHPGSAVVPVKIVPAPVAP